MKPMTEAERQSWEKVRADGRERFLLRNISEARWVFVGGALVELCWWLFTRKLSEPLWRMGVKWCFVALASGAFGGLVHWNTNEAKYHEFHNDEAEGSED